jgi:sn-glycerol 3-phosphate transport system substrate-binding protein
MKKCVSIAALLLCASAHAQTQIEFWHGLGGATGAIAKTFADEFNASQKEYQVIPVYKGNYSQTLTAAISAYRAKQPPAIVQVYEVGTASMMAAQGAIYPVHQLMADTGEPFDPKNYVAPVLTYYSTTDGKLLSMPFNSSTPVLFWNKELFQKAGLNPDVPPKTWQEMDEFTKKLAASGAKCGLTVQYAPWTLIESVGAWHDKPFATNQNGFGGKGTQLIFNDPLRVRLIDMLASWQKDGRFKYYGRETKSMANFTSGECAMHIASSGVASYIEAGFGTKPFGTSVVPYFSDEIARPQNSLIGGATLWVMQGKSKETYKGVAKFFTFLAKPDIQARWHQQTGFIPITKAAYELTSKAGYYDKFPAREVGYKSLTLNPPTVNSKGLRIGNFVQLREVMDSELEAVWNGQQSAKQGLDSMVRQGNELLRKFDAAAGQ